MYMTQAEKWLISRNAGKASTCFQGRVSLGEDVPFASPKTAPSPDKVVGVVLIANTAPKPLNEGGNKSQAGGCQNSTDMD